MEIPKLIASYVSNFEDLEASLYSYMTLKIAADLDEKLVTPRSYRNMMGTLCLHSWKHRLRLKQESPRRPPLGVKIIESF